MPPKVTSTGSGPVNAPMPVLQTTEGKFQPPKVVLNGVEGWGKTSCGAFAPKPAILMAKGETGYLTLLGAGSVPSVPNTIINSWPELIGFLDVQIGTEELVYKTLILDAVGGFEKLCHELVCRRDFKGDWGEKGFASFQKGYDVSVNDWLGMLHRLDKLNAKGVMIIMLGHTQIRPFKNPMSEDFDRYVCDIHHKTWSVTHKWADAVLFGTYVTVVDKISGRAKGIGGAERIVYTERRDAFDAKNRYGMPERIEIPDDSSKIWSTIWKHIYRKEGK
ncbi:MAG: AAA family ATPase [Sedimentisphaerales bacterium]|nr:AAA family ATPase [Sedimentisphaerales bacterium]